MSLPIRIGAAALSAALLSCGATDARAETFHTCTGFIASVPTTISTQGIWCMNKDLASNLASGNLITIDTNNVTIDCNGYKLGGLGAGVSTATYGIFAVGRNNVTVRGCNIRGFKRGLSLAGAETGGHTIVDNRFESNTEAAVFLGGTGNRLRGNLVLDSGGSPGAFGTFGIYVVGDADVIDNTVDGVVPSGAEADYGSYGIALVSSANSVARGNRVREIAGGTSEAYGIAVYSGTYATVEDNVVSNGTGSAAFSFFCSNEAIIAGNRAMSFGTLLSGCDDDGDNISK